MADWTTVYSTSTTKGRKTGEMALEAQQSWNNLLFAGLNGLGIEYACKVGLDGPRKGRDSAFHDSLRQDGGAAILASGRLFPEEHSTIGVFICLSIGCQKCLRAHGIV